MFRRICLITLTLATPVLHGMWCFDQSFKDSCREHVRADMFLSPAIQASKDFEAQLVAAPTYELLVASLLRGHHTELARALLPNRVGAFRMPCLCSKKLTLQKLQNSLERILPELSSYVDHKNSKMVAAFITKIILTESQHPGYQSFFHGTDSGIAVLFELHKKLYAKFHGKKPVDFEFLRARGTRKELTGITRDDYLSGRKGLIRDFAEPDRTNLLSVAYVPLSISMMLFFANSSCFWLNFEKFFKDTLASYNLPMPCIDFHDTLPEISYGLLLHVLIKNNVADRIVYNARDCGRPNDQIAIPTGKKLFYHEARIILDPTVFDDPSDDVKIFRYQELSDEEQKKIDAFCDNLIADAEKLKAEQEKERK